MNSDLGRRYASVGRFITDADSHKIDRYFGYQYGTIVPDHPIPKEEWAKNITYGLVPKLHRMLYGNVSDDVMWRSEEKVSEETQVTKRQLQVTCRDVIMTRSDAL